MVRHLCNGTEQALTVLQTKKELATMIAMASTANPNTTQTWRIQPQPTPTQTTTAMQQQYPQTVFQPAKF
jgi:hypothetical protein